MRKIRFITNCTIEGPVPAVQGVKASSRSGHFEIEDGAIIDIKEARAKIFIRAGVAIPSEIMHGAAVLTPSKKA